MLKTRIITALVLLVLFLLDLFLASDAVFALSLAVVASACAWEWSRLAGVQDENSQTAYSAIVGLISLIALYLPYSEDLLRWAMLLGVVFWGSAVSALYLKPKMTSVEHPSMRMLFAGALMLVIAVMSIQYLRTGAFYASPGLLLYAFCVVWFMDVGAYFSGRRFGKRKLAPLISPGKSWEGVYGGIAVTVLLAVAVLLFVDWPEGRRVPLVIATIAAAAISVVGDLFESRVKRASNTKDSSQLLPGHGGVLDRLDGVLAALPVFAFVWAWM